MREEGAPTREPPAADQIRAMLTAAVRAGRHGDDLRPEIAEAIATGGDLPLESLEFDSLAWMEFCISIELQCGAELSPADIETMRGLADVEAWLKARLAS